VARAFRCADPEDAARIDANTAFEIGSVSKTMTAVLLADLIGQDKAALDDPLSDYLPEGTSVPTFDGQPILLRHVVTHTSGLPALPSRLGATDMSDPYANLTEEALLASLGDVTLASAPGSAFEYSNFASMVLSCAVARRAGGNLEALLKQRLFMPLGMAQAYINDPPAGVRAAKGHTPNTQPTSAWNFATNLAGVGGVRATLEDMLRYVQGNLGLIESPISAALELAQQPVSEPPPMAMNWMLAQVDGRVVHTHEGGTGGFSAFVAVDREKQRGVVILSDTAWHSIGSLGSLGLHLIDASLPLGQPRKRVAPPQELLEALAGDYQLRGAMKMTLRQYDGTLFAQSAGQPEIRMGYDDAGDFFPLEVDALLTPQKKADGEYGFTWTQLGAAFPATRIDADGERAPAPVLSGEELAAYAGDYPLMPGFVLTVRARAGQLHAQATGQGEFPLDATGQDRFEAAAYGIEIVFRRDGDGAVAALDLHQGGQVLSGARN
jgi:CubicO group peptidase (beta-lactamase class C family)